LNGLHTRGADLVHRGAGHVVADACEDGRLPGGSLAKVGLQHATHEHLIDLLGVEAGLLQGALDGRGPKARGGHGGQGAEEAADGGADGGYDDDFAGHGRDVFGVLEEGPQR